MKVYVNIQQSTHNRTDPNQIDIDETFKMTRNKIG